MAALLAFQPHDPGCIEKLDALPHCCFEVFGERRQRLAAAPGDDGHRLRAATKSGAGGVDGLVANADDDGGVPERVGMVARRDIAQEGHRREGALDPGEEHRLLVLRAERQQDGIVLVAQLVEGDVFSQASAHTQVGTHAADDVDLHGECFAWEAERRDGVTEHASRFAVGIEDGTGVAGFQQGMRGREAGGAGPDDRDALAAGLATCGHLRLAGFELPVAGVAHQSADGDGVLAQATAAGVLAVAGTDAAESSRQRDMAPQDL